MVKPCSFDDLKKREGAPLNSWGLYGEDNDLGRLNLIDEAAVKRGRDAVKHGVRVNLNLPLDDVPIVIPDRMHIHREIKLQSHWIDEVIQLNTQSSTQWDGFKHFGYMDYPKKGVNTFHGGLTQEQAGDIKSRKFGIQNMADYPITSRAHFLDIPRWLEKNGKPSLQAMSNKTPVTLEMLKGCSADHGIKYEPGDVLIVRTGFTEGLTALDAAGAKKAAEDLHNGKGDGFVGVDSSEEVMRWHWNNGIAAVAGDAVAYEAFPSSHSPSIHEVFLAGWGLPLGELFDLRKLSEVCAKLDQYTFMFASCGLNLAGGIATPANAQAIL